MHVQEGVPGPGSLQPSGKIPLFLLPISGRSSHLQGKPREMGKEVMNVVGREGFAQTDGFWVVSSSAWHPPAWEDEWPPAPGEAGQRRGMELQTYLWFIPGFCQ